jgi:hypothetical protein
MVSIFVGSLSINLLYRLIQARKEFSTDGGFEDSTHIPYKYVKISMGLMILYLLLFFGFFIKNIM